MDKTCISDIYRLNEFNEVVPVSNYREAFERIFPENLPPALRNYKAYLVTAATLGQTPLTESEWSKRVKLT